MADKPRRKRYAEWPGATEYQRRQARGRALGLTPTQAAGKPKPTETPASVIGRGVRKLWEVITGKPAKAPKPKPGGGIFDGGRRLPPPPPPSPPSPPSPPPPPEEPERPTTIIGGGGGLSDAPSDSFPVPIPFDELAAALKIDGQRPIATWDGREISPAVARGLLWTGWFDPDVDFDDKAQARQDFLDYTGLQERDAWDAWREWYSDTAA